MRTCPGCGGQTFSDRELASGLASHRCGSCGLLISTIARTGPVKAEFDLVDQRAYLDSVGETRRRQASGILSLLEPRVPPGARLLDVGCSFGFFLAEARRRGLTIGGVEPDRRAFDHATALLGDGVVQFGMFEPGAYPEASVDVIATLDVLEHIPVEDQPKFASVVRETLVPNGLWVIKVPSTEGLYYKASYGAARVVPRVGATLIRRMWQTDYEFPHTVYFSRSSLDRWLDRHGFDVVAWDFLPEVPPGTVIDRLTTDGRISRRQAALMAPALYAVHALEAVRRKSDALVVLARAR